jgi:MFS family permease
MRFAASRALPPPGPARLLAAVKLVITIGDGMYYVCLALYFTRVLGMSPVELGSGLTAAWAVSLAVAVPVGHLADRWGPRRVAIVLWSGAAAAMIGYQFARSFPAFMFAACVYTICTRGGVAAVQALVAGLIDDRSRVRIRAFLQSALNLGLAAGACVGVVALAIGTPAAYRTVLLLDAVSFALGAVLMLRVADVPPRPRGELGGGSAAVLRDRRYVLITAINTVLVMHVPLIDVALPLWVVDRTAAPRWIVAVLFIINTLMVVVLQVRISNGVKDLPSAGRYIRRSGLLLLLSALAFAASAAGHRAYVAAGVLMIAAALQALGEMVQFSGTWEISFSLAPPDKQGQYQAFFGSSMTVAQMVGPLALTALLVRGGPIGWVVLGAAFGVCGLALSASVRTAQRVSTDAFAGLREGLQAHAVLAGAGADAGFEFGHAAVGCPAQFPVGEEQNPAPAPMTTTTRVSLSRLISSSACRNGIITSNDMAFIRSGRLSVTRATCGLGLAAR